MPRKDPIDMCGVASAKAQAPGALHHVIVRGIEKRNIFRNDYDRSNFLERIDAIIDERLEAYHQDPNLGSPWEAVFNRIVSKNEI
jgi:hypothetical protein